VKKNLRARDVALAILIIVLVVELSWGTAIIQEEKTVMNSSNTILVDDCICLDYNPYDRAVYIGTARGVFEYRIAYDDLNWILNSTDASHTLSYDISTFSHSFVFSLTSAPWGGVYFCGGSLAGEIETKLVNITGASTEPERRFSCISSGSSDPLLILGGNGNTLFIYNYSSHAFMRSIECEMLGGANEILRVGSDIFVGTNDGLVIYNLETNITLEYPMYSSDEVIAVDCLEFDHAESELYLGTSHGVYIYELQSNNTLQFTDRITEADGILSSDINCIELDTTTERLYIGSSYGISVYDLQQRTIRKNYANLFSSEYQVVSDMVLARYFGRVRKLIVSSRFNGIAMVDVNNLMNLDEYTTISYSYLITMIGIPTTLLGIYVAGEKRVTRRVLMAYLLTIAFLMCSTWIIYLNSVISIPNSIPDPT
jgi:hypothetical protein